MNQPRMNTPHLNTLSKLQHTFQDCVMHPGRPDAASWVSASGRADPDTQLSIYSYAYAARLREVLAKDYPAVLMAIGDARFEQLADAYIQAHPSHYVSLRDFGQHLAGFVSGLIQKDTAWQDMPWLLELALFEWTLGQAFDAADASPFTEQDMAAIPPDIWPGLCFTLHPAVQRLNLEWNIPPMWQALTADVPEPVSATRHSASPWLIWREQLITRFRSMETDEQQALDALSKGASFNDICQTLANHMPEENVPLHAASLLKAWIAQGLISGVQ